MAQNIYRRDTRQNLLDLSPSSKEIVTIEDNTKLGLLHYGQLRTIAQFLEKGTGIEIRDFDENFAKGILGQNALDFSTAQTKFGTGASGDYSVALNLDTNASGDKSVALGNSSIASGENSIAGGDNSEANGKNSISLGDGTEASGKNSISLGDGTEASGKNSISLGDGTEASGKNSISLGDGTEASGDNSFSIGAGNEAIEANTFASGLLTKALGINSSTFGNNTTAQGHNSHAEGNNTTAQGDNSHAEGTDTTAQGHNSHAEGNNTTAQGDNSHAEGTDTTAQGDNSHASGLGTISSNDNETVIGTYNDDSNPETIFSVGIGDSVSNRKNALEVDKDGSVIAPSLTKVKIDSPDSLVTKEFVQDKLTPVDWYNDFDVPSAPNPIFESDILDNDIHANISAVFLDGILLRPSKYIFLNFNGHKSVQLDQSITINENDWVSLQNTRVFIQD